MNVLRYNGEWHANIPTHSILRNDKLTVTARMLWAVLQSYASADRPNPFPGHPTLMKILKLKRSMLSIYQKELVDSGLLKIEKQRRGERGKWASNVYILSATCSIDINGSQGESGLPDGTVFNTAVSDKPDTVKSEQAKQNQKSKKKNGARTVSNTADTAVLDISKSPFLRENTKAPGAASPLCGVALSNGASAPEGTSAHASVQSLNGDPEEEQGDTPSQKIVRVSKHLPTVLKKIFHGKQKPTFNSSALTEGKTFFEDNPHYEWCDVLYLSVKGIFESHRNLAPNSGFDPYFYSRKFAHMPNKLFEKNKDFEDIVLLIAKELKYTVRPNFGYEEIIEEVTQMVGKLAGS